MSSIREQLVVEITTALTNGRPAGVPLPVRTRVDPPTPDTLPTLSVWQVKETVGQMQPERPGAFSRLGPVVRRTLELVVEVCTSAATAEADKAADPILTWASKALAALDLASMVVPIEEIGTEFSYVREGDVPLCRALMSFRVSYDTLANNPEAIQ